MALLVVLTFWAPGALVGAALRLRGWTLAAAAPLLTFGSVATGAVAVGALGLKWTWWTFGSWVIALSAAFFAAAVFLLPRLPRRLRAATEVAEVGTVTDNADTDHESAPILTDEPRPLRDHLIVGAGVALGAAIGALAFVNGIGNSLQTINQDWDAPFHGNAIRWIAEHHDANPASLATIANTAGTPDFFYPNTYHALLALLFGHAGLGVPQLLNLAALVTVLVIPVGVAAVGMAWRMPALGVAAAAVGCTWFSAFPYDQLWRGPLWPFAAGLALIPALLALARHLVVPRGLAGPVGIALGVTGLVGLHTSMIFVLAIYGTVLLLAMLLRAEPVRWRTTAPALVATAVLAVGMVLPVLLPALYNQKGVTDTRWPQIATESGAFGQSLLFSPMQDTPQWWIGLPALLGAILLVAHRRLLWMVGAFVACGALYAACAALDSRIVNIVTGPFYNDPWRLGALVPLAGAFAFGEFVDSSAGAIQRLLTRLPTGARWPATPVRVGIGALVVAILATLSHGAYHTDNSLRLQSQNKPTPRIDGAGYGGTVLPGERDAFAWLAAHAGRGPVMNDRSDGSIWMYALSGVKPVNWTFFPSAPTTTTGMLLLHFNKIGASSEVQQAVERLGIRYVIVCQGMVRGLSSQRMPGLVGLENVPRLRLVYTNPDAMIYEITP